ncbi:MAG: M14 family metallopeptidase, partial [Gammaproteobacteria bacterium]
MSWKPYDGSEYLDFAAVENFCRNLAAQHPEWVTLEEIGRSHHDRPLLLLTLSRTDGDVSRRPGFWLDGGTHAAEFTGVMAAIYAVSRWVSQLAEGEKSVVDWFSHRAVYVMPCISPDGFQAMCDGAPFIRSSLRPPQPGTVRSGLDPCDIDGDGVVRWMRWKHPAGPFVPDPDVPLFMRPRTLEDDPEDAYFLCDEGEFIQWDGGKWRSAPKAFGVDLNRNFPGSWQPFEMFGMDGGAFSLSEPESRAVVDAFSGRPFIGAGLTNHTYTGCLLTQPYAKNPPISKADIDLMEHLAKEAVKGTDYKVFKVNPEFTYDPDKLFVGVWADSMVSVFGVPGYTLELWDPLGEAGLELEKPLEFFLK